jgi:hypothetical protein
VIRKDGRLRGDYLVKTYGETGVILTEETTDEHGECQCAEAEDQISPTHVLRLVTRGSVGGALKLRDERPGNWKALTQGTCGFV